MNSFLDCHPFNIENNLYSLDIIYMYFILIFVLFIKTRKYFILNIITNIDLFIAKKCKRFHGYNKILNRF